MEELRSNLNPKTFTYSDDIQSTDETDIQKVIEEEEKTSKRIGVISVYRKNLDTARKYSNAKFAFGMTATILTLTGIVSLLGDGSLTTAFVNEIKHIGENEGLKQGLPNLFNKSIILIAGAAASWVATIRCGHKANKYFEKVERMENGEEPEEFEPNTAIDFLKINDEIEASTKDSARERTL